MYTQHAFYNLSFSAIGFTSFVAHMVTRMGEGMKIHISETTKRLLDKVGGFSCEYRGIIDLGVCV